MKYLEYVPILFMTNFSTLLLMSVDGIVVGNYMGGLALAAVNMFTPISILLSAYIAIISHGIADSFADALVGNNPIDRLYNGKAIKFVILVSLIILSIIQIPIAHFIIHSYKLTKELHELARAYAIALLISMPFQLLSSIGACQFQEIGDMKSLMFVAIIEATINLILDVILVGIFRMGVFGAGIATAIACIIRSIFTVEYFLTKTNIYKKYRVKIRMRDVKEIIFGGLPYSVGILSSAIQGYFLLRIILLAYGEEGGIVNGVCYFCLSIATVFISSSCDANGPLNGIFLSIDDRVAVRNAFRIAARQIIIATGIFILLIELRPEWMYIINGVSDIPKFGLDAIKLYSLCFLPIGLNNLFQGYFIDKKEFRLMSRLTFFGDVITPLVAFVSLNHFGKIYLWAGKFVVAFAVLIIYLIRYFILYENDLKESISDDILYLEVKPNDAVDVSEQLHNYAKEKNSPDDLSNDLALCAEEMVKNARNKKDNNVYIQIMVHIFDYGAKFVMLDNGERLNLNDSEVNGTVVTDNYELVRKMAKRYSYQYVLNMNNTTFEF